MKGADRQARESDSANILSLKGLTHDTDSTDAWNYLGTLIDISQFVLMKFLVLEWQSEMPPSRCSILVSLDVTYIHIKAEWKVSPFPVLFSLWIQSISFAKSRYLRKKSRSHLQDLCTNEYSPAAEGACFGSCHRLCYHPSLPLSSLFKWLGKPFRSSSELGIRASKILNNWELIHSWDFL